MVDISFSNFAELKRNSTKSEIVSIGVLKGTQVAVRGMDCIDVTTSVTMKNWKRERKLVRL